MKQEQDDFFDSDNATPHPLISGFTTSHNSTVSPAPPPALLPMNTSTSRVPVHSTPFVQPSSSLRTPEMFASTSAASSDCSFQPWWNRSERTTKEEPVNAAPSSPSTTRWPAHSSTKMLSEILEALIDESPPSRESAATNTITTTPSGCSSSSEEDPVESLTSEIPPLVHSPPISVKDSKDNEETTLKSIVRTASSSSSSPHSFSSTTVAEKKKIKMERPSCRQDDDDNDEEEEELRLLLAAAAPPPSAPCSAPSAPQRITRDKDNTDLRLSLPSAAAKDTTHNHLTKSTERASLAMKGMFFESIRSALYASTLQHHQINHTARDEENEEEPSETKMGENKTALLKATRQTALPCNTSPDQLVETLLSSMEKAVHSHEEVSNAALLHGYFQQCVEPLLHCASLSAVNATHSGGQGTLSDVGTTASASPLPASSSATATSQPSKNNNDGDDHKDEEEVHGSLENKMAQNAVWMEKLFIGFQRLLQTSLIAAEAITRHTTTTTTSAPSPHTSSQTEDVPTSLDHTPDDAFCRLLRLAWTWGRLCHTTRVLPVSLSASTTSPSSRGSQGACIPAEPKNVAALSHPSFWMLCNGACSLVTAYVLRLIHSLASPKYQIPHHLSHPEQDFSAWCAQQQHQASVSLIHPLLDELWITLSGFTSRFASSAMLRDPQVEAMVVESPGFCPTGTAVGFAEKTPIIVGKGTAQFLQSRVEAMRKRDEEWREHFRSQEDRDGRDHENDKHDELEREKAKRAEKEDAEAKMNPDTMTEKDAALRIATHEMEAMLRDAFPALCAALEQQDREIHALTWQMSSGGTTSGLSSSPHFVFPDIAKRRKKMAFAREHLASTLLSAAVLDTHTAEPVWWVVRSFVLHLRVAFAERPPFASRNASDNAAPKRSNILEELYVVARHQLLQDVLSRFLVGVEERLDLFQRHQQTLLPMALAAVQEEQEMACSGSRPFFPSPPADRPGDRSCGTSTSSLAAALATSNPIAVVSKRAADLTRRLYDPCVLSEALVWEDVVRLRNMSLNRPLWWDRMALHEFFQPQKVLRQGLDHQIKNHASHGLVAAAATPGTETRITIDEEKEFLPAKPSPTAFNEETGLGASTSSTLADHEKAGPTSPAFSSSLPATPPHLEHALSMFWTTLAAHVHAVTVLQVTQEAPETVLPKTIGDGKLGGRSAMGFTAPRARLRQAEEAAAARERVGGTVSRPACLSYARGMPPFASQALAIALHGAVEACSRHLALVESAACEVGGVPYLCAVARNDRMWCSGWNANRTPQRLLHCLGEVWSAPDCFAAAQQQERQRQDPCRVGAPSPSPSCAGAVVSTASLSSDMVLSSHRHFLGSFFYLTYHPTCYALLSQYRRNPHQRHLLRALQQLARVLLPDSLVNALGYGNSQCAAAVQGKGQHTSNNETMVEAAGETKETKELNGMEQAWMRLVEAAYTLRYRKERQQRKALEEVLIDAENPASPLMEPIHHTLQEEKEEEDDEDDDWWNVENDDEMDEIGESNGGGAAAAPHDTKANDKSHHRSMTQTTKARETESEEALVLLHTPQTAAAAAVGQDMYLHMFLYHTFLSLLPYAEFSVDNVGGGGRGIGASFARGGGGFGGGGGGSTSKGLSLTCGWVSFMEHSLQDKNISPATQHRIEMMEQLVVPLLLRISTPMPELLVCLPLKVQTLGGDVESSLVEEHPGDSPTDMPPITPPFTATFLLLAMRAAGMFQLPWNAGETLLVLHRFQRLCQHLLHQEQVRSPTRTTTTGGPQHGSSGPVPVAVDVWDEAGREEPHSGRKKGTESEWEDEWTFLSRRKRCRAMQEAFNAMAPPDAKRRGVELAEEALSQPFITRQRWTLTVSRQHAVLQRLRGIALDFRSNEKPHGVHSVASIPLEERVDTALLHEIDRENANEQPLLRVVLQRQEQQEQKPGVGRMDDRNAFPLTQDSSSSSGAREWDFAAAAEEERKQLEHVWRTLEGGGNPSTHWLLEGAALLQRAAGTTCLPPAPCGALMVMSTYATISSVLQRRREEWMEACVKQLEDEEIGEGSGGGGGYGAYGGSGGSSGGGFLGGGHGPAGDNGGGGAPAPDLTLPPFCSPEDVTVLLLHIRALHRMLFTFNVQSFQALSSFLQKGDDGEDLLHAAASSIPGHRLRRDGEMSALLSEALRQHQPQAFAPKNKGGATTDGIVTGDEDRKKEEPGTRVFLEAASTAAFMRFYLQGHRDSSGEKGDFSSAHSGAETSSGTAVAATATATAVDTTTTTNRPRPAVEHARSPSIVPSSSSSSFSLFQLWLSYLHHLCQTILPPPTDSDLAQLTALPPSQRPPYMRTMLSAHVFVSSDDKGTKDLTQKATTATTPAAGVGLVGQEAVCAACEGWRAVHWPIHGVGTGVSEWWWSSSSSSSSGGGASSFSTDLSPPTQIRILLGEALADLVVSGLEELQTQLAEAACTATPLFPPPPPSCFPSTSFLLGPGSRLATENISTSAAAFRHHRLRLYQRGAIGVHANHATSAPEYIVVEDVKVEAPTALRKRQQRARERSQGSNNRERNAGGVKGLGESGSSDAEGGEEQEDSEEEETSMAEWEQERILRACQWIPRQVLLGLCESLQRIGDGSDLHCPSERIDKKHQNDQNDDDARSMKRIPLYVSPSSEPRILLSKRSPGDFSFSGSGGSPLLGATHSTSSSSGSSFGKATPSPPLTYSQATEYCWLGLHGLVAFCRRLESRVIPGSVEDPVMAICLSRLWHMADVLAGRE